ncbi:substrate-binding domain-containing protein [Campylobacter californiensis]|uniref:substrate-binding domain-containing protein n=1 Tax=Campylobacter californiensis TaxID=1032243 RepID=UPI001F38095B|nr:MULTISPECIES: substrate-binding domain-containing protein [unclassified Campylobacter]
MLWPIAAAATPEAMLAGYTPFKSDSLQVWSCGGLSEPFAQINAEYEARTGHNIQYTGAFAGALGKSLLALQGKTEVFGARVLELSQNLRKAGLSLRFRPLCFTDYVLVVPKGNPAGIRDLQDLAESGVRVMLPLRSSPPGSGPVKGILKKSGLAEPVMKNMVANGACVINMMCDLVDGKGDASIIEKRLTTHDRFKDKIEYMPIDERLIPPGPLTFTLNIMKYVKDEKLAEDFAEFVCSQDGQEIFDRHGFTSIHSARGLELIERFGVKDV